MIKKYHIMLYFTNITFSAVTIINLLFNYLPIKVVLIFISLLLYIPLFLHFIKPKQDDVEEPVNIVPLNTPYADIQLPQEYVPTLVSHEIILDENNNITD